MLFILEVYHTLMGLYSRDNPTPAVLERRVIEFLPLLVDASAASALRHLHVRAVLRFPKNFLERNRCF